MPLNRILIADDHVLTRKGIELMLKASFPGTEIIEASDGKEVISQYKLHKPDIILMDYNMPEMNGYDVAENLLKINKNVKIILLTMFDTKSIVLNFFKIGGKGFISKGGDINNVSEGVRVVTNGDYYFSSVHEKEIALWLVKGSSQTIPKIKFTPLEMDIIIKMLKGRTSKEIGLELNLSTRTVETYRYDLVRKAEVKNTFELIDFLFRNGLAN